eukprot:2819470-Amphidinium_carterae.1
MSSLENKQPSSGSAGHSSAAKGGKGAAGPNVKLLTAGFHSSLEKLQKCLTMLVPANSKLEKAEVALTIK